MVSKLLTGVFAIIVAVVGVFVLVIFRKPDTTALVCGSDQIKISTPGEETLPNLLAVNAPDIAVGKVAKLMHIEPTSTIVIGNQGYCLTVGKKAAQTVKAVDSAPSTTKAATPGK